MKILSCFAFCMLFSAGLTAQIQITQANMPSIGDTIRYSTCNPGTLDFTAGGASHTWNFSNLNPTAQDLYRFQALLSTPYSTLAFTGMPIGAIGYKVSDSIGAGQAAIKNIYNFYEKKSTGWNAVGTGFTLGALPIPAGGVYSDKDEIYTFPLKYNDFDSTTFQVTTPLGNQFLQLGTFKQKGYRINTVDGWGTISTPYAANVSCIRVKSRVIESDSLKVTTLNLNVGFNANRVEYKWLSTTEKIPVLEVAGTEIAGIFTPSTVRFRDRYRTITTSNPLAPRARFEIDRYSGLAGKDTFTFKNTTTPAFGVNHAWQITPSAGARYVRSTGSGSDEPVLVFDSAGLYTITLQSTNFIGTDDTIAVNCIQISKAPVNSVHTYGNSGFKVFPNPGTGLIYLNNPEFTGHLCRIFDLNGKLLQESVVDASLKINISALSPGLHTLVISSHDYLYYTQFTKE